MITGRQVRAARALLNWKQEMLAEKALVALTALKRLESERGLPVHEGTRDQVRRALEATGVLFVDSDRGRGVMLLNRVLTVAPGKPGAHRGQGWEEVTEQAIRALAGRGSPLVAILWGRDARSLAPLLGSARCIESAHPSPNSADRGFFGSRPFSRASRLLEQAGAQPVDWKLP